MPKFNQSNNQKSRPDFKTRKEEFENQTLDVSRVTRVVAGGRRFSFRSVVAVGNRQGRVGVGAAKGKDVASAVSKAVQRAKRNLVRIPLQDGTIPHEIQHKYKGAVVFLKPAPKGRGIIAGGAIRAISELGGIEDIVAKIISRSTNALNNGKAFLGAIQLLKEPRKRYGSGLSRAASASVQSKTKKEKSKKTETVQQHKQVRPGQDR